MESDGAAEETWYIISDETVISRQTQGDHPRPKYFRYTTTRRVQADDITALNQQLDADLRDADRAAKVAVYLVIAGVVIAGLALLASLIGVNGVPRIVGIGVGALVFLVGMLSAGFIPRRTLGRLHRRYNAAGFTHHEPHGLKPAEAEDLIGRPGVETVTTSASN